MTESERRNPCAIWNRSETNSSLNSVVEGTGSNDSSFWNVVTYVVAVAGSAPYFSLIVPAGIITVAGFRANLSFVAAANALSAVTRLVLDNAFVVHTGSRGVTTLVADFSLVI
jgi:hypothetical protein